MSCPALGCGKPSSKKSLICGKHFKLLSPAMAMSLGTSKGIKAAIVFLGQKEGYLAPDPGRTRPNITDRTAAQDGM